MSNHASSAELLSEPAVPRTGLETRAQRAPDGAKWPAGSSTVSGETMRLFVAERLSH